MSVDYNDFFTTFSKSRENMKWEEIDYFLDFLGKEKLYSISILDVGCGNGRLIGHIEKKGIEITNYLGTDLSSGLITEAKKLHPDKSFQVLDMLSISEINEKFDYIFFIASFHHLKTIEERIEVLKQTKKLLNTNGTIFMTNWALNSELNSEKYKESMIENSKNEFLSQDYNIKIGEFIRYYHSFSLQELDYLFKNTGFEIVENRLFDNKRNFISIIK
ncbi:methyltransferase domain-containing protein [Candidatus Gracilibacteria bacterium]|nr:methyltransferase domain-containing protein [Candidatus Gracilibacteria bacterium]